MIKEKIIQPLDIEDQCVGIYCNNNFIFKESDIEPLIQDCRLAWRHSPIFKDDQKYTYLSIFLRNQALSEYSEDPAALEQVVSLLESQKKAAVTAKIDFSELCFYDFLPDHLIGNWFALREAAMSRLTSFMEKPKDYDILHKIHVLTTDISKRDINASGNKERIMYDIFSSATGRLATSKGSYPILSIGKEERLQVTPQNDLYLELDLNGAEIRTLLAFSDIEQPNEDIHSWNMKELAPWVTRSEAKSQFFAWLYNPKAENKEYEKYYNKKAYLKHFNGEMVKTPYGRELPVDERKALNYLLQSTTSDIVLDSAYKIMKKLKGSKSFVAFTMHDSVVLDFSREDHPLVAELKEIFETNMFGKFLSNIRIGKNFGDMKEMKV